MQLDESKPEERDSYRIRKCLETLQKLQATYTITGRLDEAFVLRDCIEAFLAGQAGVEPDPGNLTGFRNQVGQTHIFRVMGHRTGSVWGNRVYTDNSDLGAAAVHAGLLRDGQRGVVKVTILPGQDHYDGAEANGVTTSSYETWQGSYVLAPGASLKATQGGTMPEEAKKLVDELTKSEGKVDISRLWQGIDSLQKMLETAQKAEKLDEALAIREGMRAVIIKLAGARPDPGPLTSLRSQIGKSFYFVVTGKATGSIWGSESTRTTPISAPWRFMRACSAKASRESSKSLFAWLTSGYVGSESNGVVSGSYGDWQGSYRVSAFRLPAR